MAQRRVEYENLTAQHELVCRPVYKFAVSSMVRQVTKVFPHGLGLACMQGFILWVLLVCFSFGSSDNPGDAWAGEAPSRGDKFSLWALDSANIKHKHSAQGLRALFSSGKVTNPAPQNPRTHPPRTSRNTGQDLDGAFLSTPRNRARITLVAIWHDQRSTVMQNLMRLQNRSRDICVIPTKDGSIHRHERSKLETGVEFEDIPVCSADRLSGTRKR